MQICLSDSNILLRYADPNHPLYPTVRRAKRILFTQGYVLRAAPHNYMECWNVMTRPRERNGLGLTIDQARQRLAAIERAYPVMLDVPEIYAEWKKLVFKFGVSGAKVHDARLVAIMRAREIQHVLTFNASDFTRYAPLGIVAFDPNTV